MFQIETAKIIPPKLQSWTMSAVKDQILTSKEKQDIVHLFSNSNTIFEIRKSWTEIKKKKKRKSTKKLKTLTA